MVKYIIRRILGLIPTMFIISIAIFTLMKMMPQDPVALSMPSYVKANQYEVVYEQVRERLGLDEPFLIQYGTWLQNTLQGDLGTSIMYKKPVRAVIMEPLYHTLLLNGVVLLVSFSIALFGGIHSARRVHKCADHIWQGISILGMSVPTFFIALLLIYVFAFQLHLFPSGGMPFAHANVWEWLRYLCLPVASMVLLEISGTLRYVRSAMLDVIDAEYMLAAKARGLSKGRLLFHAISNCMMPIITLFMNNVATLWMGSVVIENIFAFDGIGSVLLSALQHRDYMLAIALNILYALVYVICNLLADIAYAWKDPRVRSL